MGDYRDFVGGSYLKAEDLVGRNLRVTIEFVRPEKIKSDSGEDTKLVARFINKEKGLPLNKTNLDMLYQLTGFTDYEQWAGTIVELYHDPNVKMGTKVTGGLRLREARGGSQPPAPAPTPRRPAPAAVATPPPPTGLIENDPAEEASLAEQVYDEDIPF